MNIFSVPDHVCTQSHQEVINETCSHLVEIEIPCGFCLVYKFVKIPTSQLSTTIGQLLYSLSEYI